MNKFILPIFISLFLVGATFGLEARSHATFGFSFGTELVSNHYKKHKRKKYKHRHREAYVVEHYPVYVEPTPVYYYHPPYPTYVYEEVLVYPEPVRRDHVSFSLNFR